MNEQIARVSGVSFSRPPLGLERQSPLLLVLSECPWAGAARTAPGSCECRPATCGTLRQPIDLVFLKMGRFPSFVCLFKKMKGKSHIYNLEDGKQKNGQKKMAKTNSGVFSSSRSF